MAGRKSAAGEGSGRGRVKARGAGKVRAGRGVRKAVKAGKTGGAGKSGRVGKVREVRAEGKASAGAGEKSGGADGEGAARKFKRKDFTQGKPWSSLEEMKREYLKGYLGRGKQKAPTKELISIRLSREVVAGLRGTGPGWQGRVDEVLREWLKRG